MNQAIVRDEGSQHEALAIVEKYETFVTYLYPILQRCDRKHGVFRDVVLTALFVPVGDLYHAAKSKQVSRLYAIDAQFATLRSHLRFLDQLKQMTRQQHETALMLLAQPGAMLNAWKRRLNTGRTPGKPGSDWGQTGKR